MQFSIDDDEMFFEVDMVHRSTGEKRSAVVKLSGLEILHVQDNARLHDATGVGNCSRTHAGIRAEEKHPGFRSTGEIRRVSIQ